MSIRKKLPSVSLVVSADHVPNGMCLRLKRPTDKHDTSIAILEQNGETVTLTVCADVAERFDVKIRTEDLNVKEY